MAEALAQVKCELGRDAIILRTRNVRTGRLWGWLRGRRVWQVTATPNMDLPPHSPTGSYVSAEGSVQSGKSARRTSDAARAADGSGAVTNEVSEIRRMVEALLSMSVGPEPAETPTELKEMRLHLLRQEVSEQVADELIRELALHMTGKELSSGQAVRARLAEMIAGRVMSIDHSQGPARNGRPQVMAFIGPTGVGKTTTIAKLAATFKIRENRKVGMITIDTFRIAAVDQLKTYAEIIEVPLHVVLTVGELRQAIEAMRDRDVLLIDTAGRSQNDHVRLNQLASFIRATDAQEVNLVVSATASRSAMLSALQKFQPMGVNRLVVTKLDEATALGTVLNVASVSKMPINYVTTGQDVPDDIAPADPKRLARCILEGSLYVVR
jgi:flagellar biosynthesis protein FlhF